MQFFCQNQLILKEIHCVIKNVHAPQLAFTTSEFFKSNTWALHYCHTFASPLVSGNAALIWEQCCHRSRGLQQHLIALIIWNFDIKHRKIVLTHNCTLLIKFGNESVVSSISHFNLTCDYVSMLECKLSCVCKRAPRYVISMAFKNA